MRWLLKVVNATAIADETTRAMAAEGVNASDISDNELRIALTAADLGFETSVVGSTDNVPTHPGYEGTAHLDAVSTLVGAADVALDAALDCERYC